MPRYKLTIEYEGTRYCGWQRQQDNSSVQSAIEQAIFQFCQEEVTIIAAGRTDAGVHAYGQVAHVDLTFNRPIHVVLSGLNAWLRHEAIAIVNVEKVDSEFHARFDARRRYYEYWILNRRAASPLQHMRMWHISKPININAMREAAQYLIGRHDFSSFRDSQCQARSPLKTLDTINIAEHSGGRIGIHLSAPSFLHHQVRIITGTLVDVGLEKYSSDKVIAILEAKDRRAAGATAPAHGLYFQQVDYEY